MFRCVLIGLVLLINYGMVKCEVDRHITSIENYPFLISVFVNNVFTNGGVIIKPNYVLTAAHGIVGHIPEDIKIRVGSSHYDHGGEMHGVSFIFIHSAYNSRKGNSHSDIAILKLERNLTYSATVGEVPLGHIGSNRNGILVGYGGDIIEDRFRINYVNIKILSTLQCIYKQKHILWPRQFCAQLQSNSTDVCVGVAGDPVLVDGKLVGLATWRYCQNYNLLDTYLKISSYAKFINSIILSC